MVTDKKKNEILHGLQQRRKLFQGSDKKFAESLGIAASQFSRINKGEFDQVLSDNNWKQIAARLGISLNNQEWKIAKTDCFIQITSILEHCQKHSISTIICDIPDIGKTVAAKWHAANHRNAIYIDCSQHKTKQRMVRSIARAFGISDKGKYIEVYESLTYYIRTLDRPFIILDEAGDLAYDAFLELKALWNATEDACGWAMIGADGLRVKIERAIGNKKVGYAETYSRFGGRYQRFSPLSDAEITAYKREMAQQIIALNAPQVDAQKLSREKEGSLRRIRHELSKL